VNFLQKIGINDIVIDPGFGFGKTTEQNFTLLSRLEHFQLFNLPILCGFSRKSMIWKTLNTTPEGALNGTTVLNAIALQKGCNILRVHDVKGASETIKLTELLK
jgi:dihydropteroate synthase